MKKTVIIVLVLLLSLLAACDVDAPQTPNNLSRFEATTAPLPYLLPDATLFAVEINGLAERWSELQSIEPIARFQRELLAAIGIAPDLFMSLAGERVVFALVSTTDGKALLPLALIRASSTAGDSAISLIGPKRYKQGTLSATKQLFKQIQKKAPVLYHTCGDNSRIDQDGNDMLRLIATTGAAGMALEVLILYTFQANEGTLNARLAVLVAAFMAGLAVGAFLGRRYLARGRPRDGLVADAGVMAFLLLSAGGLTHFAMVLGVALLWSLVAGLVTGAAFPALLGKTIPLIFIF